MWKLCADHRSAPPKETLTEEVFLTLAGTLS